MISSLMICSHHDNPLTCIGFSTEFKIVIDIFLKNHYMYMTSFASSNLSLSNIIAQTGVGNILPLSASNLYAASNISSLPTQYQPLKIGFFRGLSIVSNVAVSASYGTDVTASRNGTYVKLRDPRQLLYFQTGRLETTAIIDGFNSVSPPGDGWVQITSTTGGCHLVLNGNEYITMSGTSIIKSLSAGTNGVWAVYYNSSTLRYYLRNVNYNGGRYFMYAAGNGTVLLAQNDSNNVNVYGKFYG
jgi:hypothetical protein